MLETDIVELVNLGHLKDAAIAIDRLTSPSSSLRVLRAQLEECVGSPLRARSSAESLLREHLNTAQRAHCHELVGRISMTHGQIDAGMKAMKKALALASEAQSPQLEARLAASNAEALLHCVAIEPAAEEIPRIRRSCLAAGDPHTLIIFHKVIAEIQAKKGLAVGARQSLQSARSLLSSWPNVWLQGKVAVTSSGIELFQSHYRSAFAFTQEALHCAQKAGALDIRVPALGNLAHIWLAQGKFAEAKEAIKTVQAIRRVGGHTEVGYLDTEMEIALAAGDLEVAKALAQRINEISGQIEGGHSYHGLWNKVTQVRLQYRLGDAKAGLAIAKQALAHTENMDRNLHERMQLLVAEGLGRTAQSQLGANVLAGAINSNVDSPLELIGDACRVTGLLTVGDNAVAAMSHFRRAASIFEAIGNLTARADVNRSIDEFSASTKPSVDTRPPAAALVERVATLLEFATNVPLLAADSLSLMRDADCLERGAAFRFGVDGNREAVVPPTEDESDIGIINHPEAVRIELGQHDSHHYSLFAIPKSSPTARATLLAVERLIHHSLGIIKARLDKREQAAFWPERSAEQELGLVCASERMTELIKTIRRVAGSSLTVLIRGETGVGKELFARALHVASLRKSRTFLPFNCGTVPRDMLDSQLFGHRKGAFTGAHEAGPGVIRAAAGGTLFLDEIGEMSLEAQPKLLRFLESGEILPLGESKPVHVDVRVVAATNADLEQLVAQGRFREDLYYRLNVMQIDIPPLRERREEIPALVEHFLERYGREFQKPMLRVADDTLEYLLLYRWPGNVRQLANEIRRLVALVEPGSVLAPAQLSKDIVASRRTVPVPPSETVLPLDQTLAAAIEQLERAVIERALKKCDGRNDEAAKLLGLSRKGLYLKRQRLGV